MQYEIRQGETVVALAANLPIAKVLAQALRAEYRETDFTVHPIA